MRQTLWVITLLISCAPDQVATPSLDAGADAGETPEAGRADDAGVSLGDAGPSDSGDPVTPGDPLPTWADCRVNSQSDTIDTDIVDLCEQLHRTAPTARRFGIRWVFLNTVDDPQAWTQERIDVANNLYADANIRFETSTILTIQESVVDVLNGQTRLSLGERTADLVAHMGLDDDQPEAVVAALRERLLAVGCSAERVERLGVNTRFTHGAFLAIMARSFHEEIYVVIGDQPAPQAGVGGFSSPPIRRFDWLQRSYIALKTGHRRLTVLAHELGHYFGLKHPHALSQEGSDSCRFNAPQVETAYRARETHNLWQVLTEILGDDMDADLPAIYPAFDASNTELLDAFAARMALADTWARQRFVMTENFEPFATFADYIAHWRAGGDILQRNFMYTADNGRTVNNCLWQGDDEVFACNYPEHSRNLDWDHALIDGTILFDSGQRSNLMSYIRQPGNNAPARQAGFTAEQLQLMDLSANATARLGLRNRALAD